MILLYIFGLIIYIALPFPLQILLLIINTVTPDPIPFIDEIIMYGGALKKMMSFLDVISFFEEHEIIAFIVKMPSCSIDSFYDLPINNICNVNQRCW